MLILHTRRPLPAAQRARLFQRFESLYPDRLDTADCATLYFLDVAAAHALTSDEHARIARLLAMTPSQARLSEGLPWSPADTDTNTNANIDTNVHADANANADALADTDTNADISTDTGTNADPDPHTDPNASTRCCLTYILPRAGTISAWSSKATDIFQVCGLSSVARVERGTCYRITLKTPCTPEMRDLLAASVHDRMTETAYFEVPPLDTLFASAQPAPVVELSRSLQQATESLGLSLSQAELSRLQDYYRQSGRVPTDAELMMFAQVNSEHCRHKLFNARWQVDDSVQPRTLFEMIRTTHQRAPEGILSAYKDNAAVVAHAPARCLQVDAKTRRYCYDDEAQAFLMKVETHNHPTAISPLPGAATGSGGEIRDESATGRGGSPRMGLTGFSVSSLEFPESAQVAKGKSGCPPHIASARQIMCEAPIGGARFNNEFGRPNVCGYFREFEQPEDDAHWGYHKPIMLAGGLGSIRARHVHKQKFAATTPLVVLGGPAMLIGLGGGSASSVSSGVSSEDLDFASVQRDNAEMQRRCQEVIEQCTALADANPILAIHDVGAGGLANALPELVHDAELGGHFELRAIPCADQAMSPMEIWCNEAQERYVAAIAPQQLQDFLALCERERCPVAVVGQASDDGMLIVHDRLSLRPPIRMPMSVLFEKSPDEVRQIQSLRKPALNNELPASLTELGLEKIVERVVRMPTVASKSFLITIGDRSVTGLISRDQMVGPWQVPVADVAVSASDYSGYRGEAMAVAERAPVAINNAPASGRLAVAEAVLNILASDVRKLSDIRLSANWMAAANEDSQALALYQTVQAVAEELCPALGIAIPVGKDSLSMQTCSQGHWVTAPLSLVVSAFAPLADIRRTLTPQLALHRPGAELFLIDLSNGRNRLGGSCLLQTEQCLGGDTPDLDDPHKLIDCFNLLRYLREQDVILAYHDRSDGGLFVTLMEMAFASHCGISWTLDANSELLSGLFSEEPGVVVQLTKKGVNLLRGFAEEPQCKLAIHYLGVGTREQQFELCHRGESWSWDVMDLKRQWSKASQRMQKLRDNPACADEEMESVCDAHNPGLSADLSFELAELEPPRVNVGSKPQIAIFREQGINGHKEMAAAFERAGFVPYDVHLNDLLRGEIDLSSFHGLAACGGFSYGDVLGAGAGWAHSILLHDQTRRTFEDFFNRSETFTLGVCNGCQMLARIKELIPGAAHWPSFERNRSEQFEARLSKVAVSDSPSILFKGMVGSKLPIVVAHGEGQATLPSDSAWARAEPYTCLRYIDNYDRIAEHYPANPNGSRQGATAFCSEDGRATIMMPHPERLFRSIQYSWRDPSWGEAGPWLKLFQNAYAWVTQAK